MTVGGISIYPIKSLDGTMLTQAACYRGGIIGDRAFRIIRKSDGKQMSAKIEPKLIQVRSTFSGPELLLTPGKVQAYMLTETGVSGVGEYSGELMEGTKLDELLSDFLGYSVSLRGSWFERYPDDSTNPGPSVVSFATLQSVALRFKIEADEIVRRFRPNLILAEGGPFSEEELVGKNFQINNVEFEGRHVCRRCGVPTRHSYTAKQTPNFVADFIQWRKENGAIPVESEGGLYRLCVRTKIAESVDSEMSIKLIYPGSELKVR